MERPPDLVSRAGEKGAKRTWHAAAVAAAAVQGFHCLLSIKPQALVHHGGQGRGRVLFDNWDGERDGVHAVLPL